MKKVCRYLLCVIILGTLAACGSATSDGDGNGGSSTYSTTDAATYLVGYYWVETDDDDGTLNDDGRKIVMYITENALIQYIQDDTTSTNYTKDAEYSYSSIQVWQDHNNSFFLYAEDPVIAFVFISTTQIWVWDDDLTDDEFFDRYTDVTELGITLSDG